MKKTNSYYSLLTNPRFVMFFLIILTLIASIHKNILAESNNFLIFKTSFFNLINQVNLYAPNNIHNDFHRYSPPFSVLFAPFAILPVWLGSILLNLLNVLLLYISLYKLKIDKKKSAFVIFFSSFELLTSVQNFQLNALLLGLMLLSFSLLENRKFFISALLLVIGFTIKVYPIAPAIMILFYPQKTRFITYIIFWIIVIFLSPLLFADADFVIAAYKTWVKILTIDHSNQLSFSIISVINKFFKIKAIYIQLTGLILLLVPFIYIKKLSSYNDKLRYLCSILIWLIIFNHKSESPTFIIAVIAAAIWFVTAEKSKLNIILISMVFVFTTLSPTTFFPSSIRNFLGFHILKPLPCILVWIKIQYDIYKSIFLKVTDHIQ